MDHGRTIPADAANRPAGPAGRRQASRPARSKATAAIALRALVALTALTALGGLTGCHVVDNWLGGQSGYLLQGHDAMAYPQESVPLVARLQEGDFLRNQPDHEIIFSYSPGGRSGPSTQSGCPGGAGSPQGDTEIARSRTDRHGLASAAWVAPATPGHYVVTVRPASAELARQTGSTWLLVSVLPPDAPLLITDLDKTIVAGEFSKVLAGRAEPIPHAADVLGRLQRDLGYTVVYLTRRPALLGVRSRDWLARHQFPPGPLLLCDRLLVGSTDYKKGQLACLKDKFVNLRLGIGDTAGDAGAYLSVGIPTCIVLVDPRAGWLDRHRQASKLSSLPDSVYVVDDWRQVAEIAIDGKRFSRSVMIEKLLHPSEEPPRQ